MSDPEHIEELLSKLQGIFGKLSHSEEEEAKQKVEVPLPAPPDAEPKETPLELKPDTQAAKPPESPAPLKLFSDPPPGSEIPAEPAAAPPPDNESGYRTLVPLEDPEKLIVPTALYFPPGREAEAKSLADKLETMTPKFTKVAFRLRVGIFLPYEPKSDWKAAILSKVAESRFQTAFVVMDRPMEDAKRKSVASDLESQNIYFQEVPLAMIEKKAFYTDILLGLVFFFDSRKPTTDAEGPAA